MLVLLAPQGWQRIDAVCYRAQKRTIELASYDTGISTQKPAHVVRSGKSKTACYVRVQFDDSVHHDIACTPTQEFYNASQRTWIPAYQLNIGDELVCAQGATQTVVSILLIKEPLTIYTVEVADTHTFFVGALSMLTHNMVLPMAFSIALSIPFGVSTGSTAGSFFGPVTCALGAAIGGMVGLIVTAVCDSRVPCYTLGTCDVNTFEQYIRAQPVQSYTTTSEPEIVCGEHYIQTEVCSIVVQPKIEDKSGCGSTTPQKPLILITYPAEPMPLNASPGCFPIELPIQDTRLINDAIPPKGIKDQILVNIAQPLQRPQILCAGQTVDEVIKILHEELTDPETFGQNDSTIRQYKSGDSYEDAERILKDLLTPTSTKVIPTKDGDVLVAIFKDGSMSIRRHSSGIKSKNIEGLPTIQIQKEDRSIPMHKYRLDGEGSVFSAKGEL